MRQALEKTIKQMPHSCNSNSDEPEYAYCKRCDFQWLLDHTDSSQWYIVDINNDGIAEYVYTAARDYWNLVLYIARICKNGTLTFLYEELEIPTHHAEPFHNEITQQKELFVCLKGTHYLCCSGSGHWYGAYTRDVYRWRNEIGENERQGYEILGEEKWSWCFNNDWITQQRVLFQALYNHGDYWEAYSLLHEFEMRCRDQIDPSADFWMRCDLSLVALKCGYPLKSLVILETLQKHLPALGVSPKLRKAIDHNKTQATRLQHDEQQGKRTYDAHWLLSCKGNYRIYDERMEDLLKATIPDVAAWGGVKIRDFPRDDPEHEDPWRHQLFPYHIEPASNALATGNQFITLYLEFGGYYTSRAYGLLWCDIEEKGSIIAVGNHAYAFEAGDTIYITSKTFLAHELPDEFYTALFAWIQEKKIAGNILFIDRLGIRSDLRHSNPMNRSEKNGSSPYP